MACSAEDPSEKLTFRDATAEDYEAVMSINQNVYDGVDYLPAFYMEYARDPTRHLFVAEIKGKVVAFALASVTDEGKWLDIQAGRVHSDYQRLGVIGSLKSWIFQEILQRVPTLTTLTSSLGKGSELEKRIKHDPFMRLLAKRTVLCMQVSRDELAPLVSGEKFKSAYRDCQADTAEVVSARDAQHILERGEVNTDQMAPEGAWIVGQWEPYGMCTSNYKRMVKKEVVITRDKDTGQILALSFSEFFKCDRGLLHYAHFYSAPRRGESLDLIKAHIFKHLQLLKQHAFTDNLLFWLVVPDDAPLRDVKNFAFNDLGMRQLHNAVTKDSTIGIFATITRFGADRFPPKI